MSPSMSHENEEEFWRDNDSFLVLVLSPAATTPTSSPSILRIFAVGYVAGGVSSCREPFLFILLAAVFHIC